MESTGTYLPAAELQLLQLKKNSPPNSFWVLIESRDYKNYTFSEKEGTSFTLVCGVWHCLPDRCRVAVESARQAMVAQSDFAPWQITAWEG